MYPDYRAIIVHVALFMKARCVVVALMAAHVLTPDARSCTRVDCGELFKALKSYYVQPSYFFSSIFYFFVLCGIIYLYISPSGHNSCIKLYSAWKSGKLN
jgi:hypothetical protein